MHKLKIEGDRIEIGLRQRETPLYIDIDIRYSNTHKELRNRNSLVRSRENQSVKNLYKRNIS